MNIMKKFQLGWPQVAVIGIVGALGVATYFLPSAVRDEMRADLGWAWGAMSALLGPLIRRRVSPDRDTNPETPEAKSDE